MLEKFQNCKLLILKNIARASGRIMVTKLLNHRADNLAIARSKYE